MAHLERGETLGLFCSVRSRWKRLLDIFMEGSGNALDGRSRLKGIIHRDIKAREHVFVTPEKAMARILDFGRG